MKVENLPTNFSILNISRLYCSSVVLHEDDEEGKTQAIILLKILPTPPRICKQILPSLKGRVMPTKFLQELMSAPKKLLPLVDSSKLVN